MKYLPPQVLLYLYKSTTNLESDHIFQFRKDYAFLNFFSFLAQFGELLMRGLFFSVFLTLVLLQNDFLILFFTVFE